MPVLDPLANSPTLFPLEILEKIPSFLETRYAKYFGKKKMFCSWLGCVVVWFFFFVGSAYDSDKLDFCHGVLEQSFFTTTWLNTATLQQT